LVIILIDRPAIAKNCGIDVPSPIANEEASLDAQKSIIEAARATIAIGQANQTFAGQDNKRYASRNVQQAASHIATARDGIALDNLYVVGINSKEQYRGYRCREPHDRKAT
jgi:hypothetical protein